VLKECVEDMLINGKEIPTPISSRNYTGRFMVRIPPEVHRHLALECIEAGVNLKRIASEKLAH